MEKFDYKVGFFSHSVEVSKEMITYRGKGIPENQIVAVGIGLISVAKMAIGGALGGIAGQLIAQGIKAPATGKDLNEIPKSMGQLIVAYNEGGESSGEEKNVKALRIPITTKDDTCMKMLKTVKETYGSKFKGYGPVATMDKELGISHKLTYVFVAVVVLLSIFATIIIPLNQT